MNSVTIPGIGPVSSRNLAIFGGVTVVILGVAYWRHSRAAAAAAPADAAAADTAASTYAPDSSYNPVGVGYSNQFAPNGYDVYGNPLPTPTQVGGVTTSGGLFTSNNEWAAAAEDALANAGISTTVSATAISKVLAGLAVTTDQKGIFLQAIGLFGQPPQGYPQPIHVSDPGGPSKPPVTGKPGSVSGLKATKVTRTGVRLDWSPVSGATGYHVLVNGHQQTSVVYSQYALSGLHPHTRYEIKIVPFNKAGSGGAATVHVTTHK